MKSCWVLVFGVLGGCWLAAALCKPAVVRGAAGDAVWSRKTAASYLDGREAWWQGWDHAQKEHGTVCVSCHTQVPYALVRPELMGELGGRVADQKMLASVEWRVENWGATVPFYSDAVHGKGKTAEAHASEAVLNSVILASYDAGLGRVREVTRRAFDEAWDLQEKSGEHAGGWTWQNFHLGPWEGSESGYQMATLLLLAAKRAPSGFAYEPATKARLDAVRGFLKSNFDGQPVLNQAYVLWVAGREPGLLTAEQKAGLVAKLKSMQQTDGGWCSSALDPVERKDGSTIPTASDGYATGLAVLALESDAASRKSAAETKGLAWLSGHQRADGAWDAESINKKRAVGTPAEPFMRDAATAYAVMALDGAR